MSAFDAEALWSKSQIFVRRGLRDSREGDLGSFLLWAALALEVLGKAALARIHPALIADPTHQESMFAACGRPLTPDRKSIAAKTVYERIQKLSKSFDHDAHEFCKKISIDRNAELHSGETPFHGANHEVTIPKFWRIASIILEIQGKSLRDWLGADEASSVQALINESISVIEHAVDSRIRTCKQSFDARAPLNSQIRNTISAQHKNGVLVHWRDFGTFMPDAVQPSPCPACACDGLLSGSEVGEEVIDRDSDWDEDFPQWYEIVEVTYASESFRCRACGLNLDGQEEIRAADLSDEFTVEKTRQQEFGDEYGND